MMRIAIIIVTFLFSSAIPLLATADSSQPQSVANLQLAEAEDRDRGQETPEPGSLVIPGEARDKSEKKCLNVCRQWGEDCIINPRTGSRNCRRTCKDFGMECF